ncbi:GAF domain-containing protein [Friedmanniella luteola]|uniref:GAF domain-containing protein n=1 Tax=Friedmanniella luteola TaxID=546871 RepID=A0A1H1XJQ8_9ACTN|nr:GAF and ANTAR domain-containing protein [Friedmanniella luteola]SDT09488.1 GAF domain-containing protein [Friedmanniella luteola]
MLVPGVVSAGAGPPARPGQDLGLARQRRQPPLNDDDPTTPDLTTAYAELSHVALADRPADQIFEEMTGVARRVLPEATQVSVTLLVEDRARTAASSGPLALELDLRQYADSSGPCLDAAASGSTVQLTMDEPDGPYPGFRRAAAGAGVTHSLSVSIPAGGRFTGAALNVYSEGHGPFGPDTVRTAETLAAFTGYALAARRPTEAAVSAARLQQALTSRALVKQAQGALAEQLRCSLDQAFTRLTELAEQQGVRVHDVARVVVDQQAGPPAAG